LARGAAKIGSRLTLAKEPTHVASWESPRKKDSLTVPTETKFEVLKDATSRMKAEGVVARRGQIISTKIEKYFANSERSEEHTSELQSRVELVCRLLLEKKK